MARVANTEVKVIISTSMIDADIVSHIDIANRFITDKLGSKGLGTARLKDIELYMSAHLVSVKAEKGGVKSERVGDSQRTYSVLSGTGLQMSRYGQMAAILDTSGTLLSVDKKSAVFRAL